MYEEWANRISYKATWTVSVDQETIWSIRITVTYTGPDSTNPSVNRGISHCRIIGKPGSFAEFVRECIITVQELEHHEIREWFRVDGEHWPAFIPHDPKAVMEPLRGTGARYDEFI